MLFEIYFRRLFLRYASDATVLILFFGGIDAFVRITLVSLLSSTDTVFGR